MPLVLVTCPADGVELEVSLTFGGEPPMFHLATSPEFVEHMNREHEGRMDPVGEWPPAAEFG
jgi:hypothetical protein